MKIHKTVQNLLQRRGMYTHKLISMYRREKKKPEGSDVCAANKVSFLLEKGKIFNVLRSSWNSLYYTQNLLFLDDDVDT